MVTHLDAVRRLPRGRGHGCGGVAGGRRYRGRRRAPAPGARWLRRPAGRASARRRRGAGVFALRPGTRPRRDAGPPGRGGQLGRRGAPRWVPRAAIEARLSGLPAHVPTGVRPHRPRTPRRTSRWQALAGRCGNGGREPTTADAARVRRGAHLVAGRAPTRPSRCSTRCRHAPPAPARACWPIWRRPTPTAPRGPSTAGRADDWEQRARRRRRRARARRVARRGLVQPRAGARRLDRTDDARRAWQELAADGTPTPAGATKPLGHASPRAPRHRGALAPTIRAARRSPSRVLPRSAPPRRAHRRVAPSGSRGLGMRSCAWGRAGGRRRAASSRRRRCPIWWRPSDRSARSRPGSRRLPFAPLVRRLRGGQRAGRLAGAGGGRASARRRRRRAHARRTCTRSASRRCRRSATTTRCTRSRTRSAATPTTRPSRRTWRPPTWRAARTAGHAIDVTRALTAAARAVRLNPRLPPRRTSTTRWRSSALPLRHEATRAWDAYLQTFGDGGRMGRRGAAPPRRRWRRAAAAAAVAGGRADAHARRVGRRGGSAAPGRRLPAAAPVTRIRFTRDLGAAICGRARRCHARARAVRARPAGRRRGADAVPSYHRGTCARRRPDRSATRPPLRLWARAPPAHGGLQHRPHDGRTRRGGAPAAPNCRLAAIAPSNRDARTCASRAFDYSAAALRARARPTTSARSRSARVIGDGKGRGLARLAAGRCAADARPRARGLGAATRASWPSARSAIPASNTLRLDESGDRRPRQPTGRRSLALAREAAHHAAGRSASPGCCRYRLDSCEARALHGCGDTPAAEQRWSAGADGLRAARRRQPQESPPGGNRVGRGGDPGHDRPGGGGAASSPTRRGVGSTNTAPPAAGAGRARGPRAPRPAAIWPRAEAALRKGVALVEAQQRQIARADFLPSFIDASWDVFSEFVDLKATLGGRRGGLRWLDRGSTSAAAGSGDVAATSLADASRRGPGRDLSRRGPTRCGCGSCATGACDSARVAVHAPRARAAHGPARARARARRRHGRVGPRPRPLGAPTCWWPATERLVRGGRTPARLALVLDPVLQQVPFALLPWAKRRRHAAWST